MRVKAAGITFDIQCTEGNRAAVVVMNARGDLTNRAIALQDLTDGEANPQHGRILGEIQKMRASLKTNVTTLTRHVGHCDTCTRTTPFTGDIDLTRSPSWRDKPPVPPIADLAARLRSGESVETIAAELDRSVGTLRTRITQAGYSSTTGQPHPTVEKPRPRGADLLPLWEPWRDDAVCAQTSPDEFFPEKGGSTLQAKAICDTCTVAAECLDYALTAGERFGIWGGLSERERRPLLDLTTHPEEPLDHHHKESA